MLGSGKGWGKVGQEAGPSWLQAMQGQSWGSESLTTWGPGEAFHSLGLKGSPPYSLPLPIRQSRVGLARWLGNQVFLEHSPRHWL